jgi:hypothetical protein
LLTSASDENPTYGRPKPFYEIWIERGRDYQMALRLRIVGDTVEAVALFPFEI